MLFEEIKVVIPKHRIKKFTQIINELERAEELHPVWPVDDKFHALTIITEELGELAQALLDHHNKKIGWSNVEEEAIQVAAMGLRFFFNLEE